MGAVAIVDTSILCNVLNIPKMNGERFQVMQELQQFLEEDTTLLLPMAAVYETGNHIAQLNDGGNRLDTPTAISQWDSCFIRPL